MATADGIEIEAKALVFATGYELADGVPRSGHRLASTWSFATAPQPNRLWGNGELIWEASDPYLYIRTTMDGRVVVGGEDESIVDEAARDALLPTKVEALQAKAKALFPQLDVNADYAWTGTFGESETGLPSVGAVPGMANCYAVLGYGGNGLTFSMMARQILMALLSNDCDSDADLFAFKC
jgi:glycine/D-amino acid oxidase-like deaminating enzyme